MSPSHATPSPPILSRSLVKSCHIVVPDVPQPVSAIRFGNHFFSYFRLYSTTEAVQKATAKLTARGDRIVLTQVRKGLIVWVFEPDAQLASASTIHPSKI